MLLVNFVSVLFVIKKVDYTSSGMLLFKSLDNWIFMQPILILPVFDIKYARGVHWELYNAGYLILKGLFLGNLIGLSILLIQKYFVAAV